MIWKHYVAPELLATGQRFRGDERSSIFSLGTCLFEAIVGHRPFSSPEEPEMERVLNYAMWVKGTHYRPIDFTADVLQQYPGLKRIVGSCLAGRPADRPASLSALHDELEKLAESGTVTTP